MNRPSAYAEEEENQATLTPRRIRPTFIHPTDRSARPDSSEDSNQVRAGLKAVPKEVLASVEEHVDAKSTKDIVQHPTDMKLADLEWHKILGHGALGQVWLVSANQRPYAVKVQSKYELACGEEGDQIDAALREKALLGQLNHPFVLKLIKTFADDKFVYLLSELHQGGELHRLIYPTSGPSRGLPEEQVQFYAAAIACALAYLHRKQIVFRDLKPNNVVLDCSGYPVLIDFGCAKHIPGGATRTMCGTPHYTAPEMITDMGYHGYSVDHWQLGILLYEMITGVRPFESSDVYTGDHAQRTALWKSILEDDYDAPEKASSALADLIAKLLVKNPTCRLGSLVRRGEKGILEHAWFRDVNRPTETQPPAPWVPELQDEFDTQYFENCDHVESILEKESRRLDRLYAAKFKGF